MGFLPVTRAELDSLGIDEPDFIVVTGDAYVDHPTFGHALIARIVESQGFSVAVLPQPLSDSDYLRLGAPKKAFLVAGGVVDSMVNNYTVAKRRRSNDDYSENGRAGMRPDRNVTVYSQALKRLFPHVAVIAGGIEASLRRLSHYDYWSDSVMHSILYDAPIDLLIYGMGENPIFEILEAAKRNIPLNKLKDIKGTAYLTDILSASERVKSEITGGGKDFIIMSSHERVKSDTKLYAKAFMQAYENTDPNGSKGLIQKQDYEKYAVINPPSETVTEERLDFVHGLEFMRMPHPMYKSVPAIEEVKFSVTAHRGCFGNCSFCALTYHQGRRISKRSADNIIEEVEKLTTLEGFKGYIHDIGGPSANFHNPPCSKNESHGGCKNKDCIGYNSCTNLNADHSEYLSILRRARKVTGVKKVFVRSGVRFDYLLSDKDDSFLNELIEHHVSGQLKVAPEHIADNALKAMNKPPHAVYETFRAKFDSINRRLNKKQYLVPYFISSHPGCTLSDAVKLTEYLMEIGYMPEQVQDFYPTPSTLSTTMYYTGLDPRTLEPIFCAKSAEDKAMQRALLQYRLPQNRALIEKALRQTRRTDLLTKLQKYYNTGTTTSNKTEDNQNQKQYNTNRTESNQNQKQYNTNRAESNQNQKQYNANRAESNKNQRQYNTNRTEGNQKQYNVKRAEGNAKTVHSAMKEGHNASRSGKYANKSVDKADNSIKYANKSADKADNSRKNTNKPTDNPGYKTSGKTPASKTNYGNNNKPSYNNPKKSPTRPNSGKPNPSTNRNKNGIKK